jgi:ATP-dependent RNA helicase DeaD
MFVARRDRENALINVLRYYHPRSALVFCGRRDRAAALCLWLQGRGFAATQLSGALDQAARNAAVAALRTGRVSVCVATDLAARGLDVPLLELVVHADVPGSVETLVHRSGRTGRAGRSGRAVFLVSGSERGRLAELMRRAGRPVLWRPVPRPADVFSRDLVRIVGDPVFQEAATERDLALADALMRVYGPDRIAVACGRLWFSAQPEAQPITETARLHTGTAGPSYRFAIETEIAAGQGMRPLLREIARQSGVLRTEIGRVRRGRHRIEFEVCGAPAVRLAQRIGSGEMPGVRLVSEPERPTAPD